ncbi:uncharacterized protein Z518_01048 [Rhinocladiella mackenziei CBS 650.93]|uniref:SUN domain-containing protein n=1 Tax=Rhinocladiella mackenziei CBS 650.93 TaxID=1442369 RepID=A0A0D2G5B3_9EURO|nr:uncharacterized protein Z518_01048 [Rhinocladiella mackenziei CBS 650.93]KIX09967.1 hypothetical protein Z518_01048 [Rhinocladiella mackenziei CBS 650.93]
MATPGTATTTVTPLTCPFRTANYITHSLPQQCLTSSRKTNITSTPTEVSIGLSVDRSSDTLFSSEIPKNASAGSTTPAETASLDLSSKPADTTPITSQPDQTVSSPSTSDATSSASEAVSDEPDEDSPLEDAKFLSFEDWKRENLKKAGQSEHVGKGPGLEQREPRKRPTYVQDSLDSLGDDAEIDFDFSGFVSDGLESSNHGQPRIGQTIRDSSASVEAGRSPRAGVRSKDAGTTCKERFNYASFDCAANVLKTNPEAKSASAVLGNNKDTYMLNECSAPNKFLILELCDDISIDTIVVANFEFFSSTFRTFRVSVSDKYPVKIDKWKTLGTFEARNTREVQAFLVENPVIWARYLRIEFLTHYGNEYYCPVSLVRVHGTTMLEEYKHDLESLQMEDDEEIEMQEGDESAGVDELVPEAVAEPLLRSTGTDEAETSTPTAETVAVISTGQSQSPLECTNATQSTSVEAVANPIPTSPTNFSVMFNNSSMHYENLQMCEIIANSTKAKSEVAEQSIIQSSTTGTTIATGSLANTNSTDSIKPSTSGSSTGNATATNADSQKATSRSEAADNSTSRISTSPTIGNSTKATAYSTQAPPAAPTMQESFFKSVQKRLQMLEANSSLSLQYIEEQSRALRDAFQKVEQKQLAKTTAFLEYLNTTVLNELRDFRQQYDQLWQSTVIELELQRERYQQENLAINARLGVLADEVIFQKRMSILQMILILICLGLVLFSRGSLNSYLEMPLVQSVLARSPSSKWLNLSSLDTPSQSPPVTRSNSTGGVLKRHGIFKGHRCTTSEDSAEDAMSPTDLYTPPTPVSFDDPSDGG